MAVVFELFDNSDEILKAMKEQVEAGLEACGITCEGYAQDNVTAGVPRHGGGWYTSQGAAGLKGSINHEVNMGNKEVQIGTNNDHAQYNEFGTGIYAGGGGGWWVYVPGGGGGGKAKRYSEKEARQVVAILQSKGIDAHMTQGMSALHFLKNAMANHIDEYKQILQEQLKGG